MLYRIRKDQTSFDFSKSRNLVFATSITDTESGFPFLRYAKFYCNNSMCPVREVAIRAKYPRRDRPDRPEFNCPGCGQQMKFYGHMKEVILEIVPDSEEREET